MKLLHLVVDDKFVDMAVREFEAVAPGRHEWAVLNGARALRIVKDPRVQPLDHDGLARRLADPAVRAVVCHVMTDAHLALLAAVPVDRNVVWIGWGYDYYGLINDAFPDGLLMPATARLAGRIAAAYAQPGAGAHEPTVLSHARPYRRPTAAQRAALGRVDIFSPVLDTEHRLVRRHLPELRARYLRWNYGTAEDDYSLGEAGLAQDARNLLLGNSATATNNHLELFDHVKRHVDLSGRQVVVPLSYGDGAYREAVLKAGHAAFGTAFRPLVDFMPKDEYISLLRSCGLVLMNHVRQQALGNLFISGLLGARLHLHRRSPLYHWLQSQGVPVSDVAQPVSEPLTAADRDAQVTAIRMGFGRTAQRERTRTLVEAALAPRA
jgi:hypothetical protein